MNVKMLYIHAEESLQIYVIITKGKMYFNNAES